MIWESAPTAAFVRPPSHYRDSVRQVVAVIQRSYQPSPELQSLIDDMLSLVQTVVLPKYQGKPDASEQELLADLRQEFQVFRVLHSHDIYGDLDALARLLGSDFALWAMPLDKISKFWGPSGALWKYCSGALDLLLLYELKLWWNAQPNVKQVSEQIYRKASIDLGAECEFVTVRMVESGVTLPYDSPILRELTKKHIEHLKQKHVDLPEVSYDRLLRSFPPSSDKLSRATLQRVFSETPKLLLVNVDQMVGQLDAQGALASLLKAVIDWAVYNNVKAVVQRPPDPPVTKPPLDPAVTVPRIAPTVTVPRKKLR